MTALLKKRALTEFSSQAVVIDEEDSQAVKRVRLSLCAERQDTVARQQTHISSTQAYLQLLQHAKCSKQCLQAVSSLDYLMPLSRQESVSTVECLLRFVESRTVLDTSVCTYVLRLIVELVRCVRDCREGDTTIQCKTTLTFPAQDKTTPTFPPLDFFTQIVDKLLSLLNSLYAETRWRLCSKVISCLLSIISMPELNDSTSGNSGAVSATTPQRVVTELMSRCRTVLRRHDITCTVLHIACVHALSSLWSHALPTDLALVTDYCLHADDSRVRAAALQALLVIHVQGCGTADTAEVVLCGDTHRTLSHAQLFALCASLLTQDDENMKLMALRVIAAIARHTSTCTSSAPTSATTTTTTAHCSDSSSTQSLVDRMFLAVCACVTDLHVRVRVCVHETLGCLRRVSAPVLHQTLDKRLMSDLRERSSSHQLQQHLHSSGEWLRGTRWLDVRADQRSGVHVTQMSLVESCGAFVHGLEDEYKEVREATLRSLTALAAGRPQFAQMSLDYVVDMFVDDIDSVRLQAVTSLTALCACVTLRTDQVAEILSALEVTSVHIREAVQCLVGRCALSDTHSLQLCVDALLRNLGRYPHDRRAIWRCFCHLGSTNADLVLALTPSLLLIHPFLQLPETSVSDPAYVCLLLLVSHAASKAPSIRSLYTPTITRHLHCLQDILPAHLLPPTAAEEPCADTSHSTDTCDQPLHFLRSTMSRSFASISAAADSTDRSSVLASCVKALMRLAALHTLIAPTAHFCADLLRARLSHEEGACQRLRLLYTGLSPTQLAVAHDPLCAPHLLCTHTFLPESCSQLLQLRKKRAVVYEPATSDTDTVLRFTAGLVLPVYVDAELYDLEEAAGDQACVRVQYPDCSTHVHRARTHELYRVPETECWHMRMRVMVTSERCWSDPGHIQLCVCVQSRDHVVELCEPIKLAIHPQQARKSSAF